MWIAQVRLVVAVGLVTWQTVAAQHGLVHLDGAFSPLPLAVKSNPNPECDKAPSVGFKCPEGWTAGEDKEGVICLWLGQQQMAHSNASAVCMSMGGNLLSIRSKERQVTITRFLEGVAGDIWTSAVKPMDTYTYAWNARDPLRYAHTHNFHFSDLRYGRVCVYLTDSSERIWADTYLCGDARRFACDMVPACLSRRIGQRCQSECHCLGEPCQGEQPCSSGCEMGWSGPQCCQKREPAEVAHYCIDNGEKRYMELRVDPKNTDYELMHTVDGEGKTKPWCSHIYVTADRTNYTYTIRVPVEQEGIDFNGTCGREKTGNNTFRWRIALQERSGLRLPLDRTFLITCDFDNAETLSRQVSYDLESEEARETDDAVNPVEKLVEIREDVSLDVVAPYTGDVIQQAALGTTVELRMRLTVARGLTAQGVSPFNCVASTPGREFTRRLTLHSGCPVSPVVVSSLKGSNGSVTSDPFQLFTFPGHQVVIITCHFTFCFTSAQQPLCDNRCGQMGENKTNKMKRSADDRPKLVSTKIHILPDVESKPASTHTAGGGHFDAANMMTPVTWLLVAILMVVSAVLLYMLYFRATKRTIGIRQIHGPSQR